MPKSDFVVSSCEKACDLLLGVRVARRKFAYDGEIFHAFCLEAAADFFELILIVRINNDTAVIGAAGELVDLSAHALIAPINAGTALDDDADLGDFVFDNGIGADGSAQLDATNVVFFLILQQFLQTLPNGGEEVVSLYLMFDRFQ